VQLVPNPLIIPTGMVVGILLAMPFGPVNLLALQRSVERGFLGGLAAGLGIMLGDGLIALCAGLGVNAISGAIKHHRVAVQLVGGLALIGAGLKLCLTKPEIVTEAQAEKATLGDYVWDIPQTFFLTITNPAAVLGLIAIFGGVSSFVEVASYVDVFTMTAAIMGGSLLYWIVVSQLISGIRHHLDERRLEQINQVAGITLAVFGGILISEILFRRPGFLTGLF